MSDKIALMETMPAIRQVARDNGLLTRTEGLQDGGWVIEVKAPTHDVTPWPDLPVLYRVTIEPDGAEVSTDITSTFTDIA